LRALNTDDLARVTALKEGCKDLLVDIFLLLLSPGYDRIAKMERLSRATTQQGLYYGRAALDGAVQPLGAASSLSTNKPTPAQFAGTKRAASQDTTVKRRYQPPSNSTVIDLTSD
jgi:hypothetical protein